MKKLLSIFTAVFMLIVMTATPVLASHGSHHRGRQAVSYSVCSTKSCFQTGLHYHSGKAYIAHYYADGHSYHGYCDVEDCSLVGYHSHDGVYNFGHTYNDGHEYHDYCGVYNCTITGYHDHDGVYCFGHTTGDGHNYHHTGVGHH